MSDTKVIQLSSADKVKPVANSSLVIQAYCSMIQQASTLDGGSLLPNIKEHQILAQKYAESWLSIYNPKMSSVIVDIIDYGNTFKSSYELLKPLIPKLNTDENAKIILYEGIKFLKTAVESKEIACKEVMMDLIKFHYELANNVKKCNSDNEQANVYVDGDKGEISDIKQTINSDHKAFDKANKQIVNGIIEMSAGGLSALGDSALLVFTSGTAVWTGSALTLAGSSSITVGAAINQARKARNNAIDDIEKNTASLSQIHSEINVLHNISMSLESFSGASKSAVTATSNLVLQWGNLRAELDEVIDELDKSIKSNTRFEKIIALDVANRDWLADINVATFMQKNSILPVVIKENAKEMISAMNQAESENKVAA